MKKLTLALFVAFTTALPASAQGDAKAGKLKAVVCSACHGIDGNSSISIYPKIAGQHKTYLEKQLYDFKEALSTGGKEGRADPIMGGMVASLSQQDIEDLSAYYASQTQKNGSVKDVPQLGENLYKNGDINRGITACIACHGPNGKGMELAVFPMVSGQHVDYIKSQLDKFRDEKRHNDLNGMMRDIAKKLTNEDIDALSLYISSLK